MRLIVDCGYQSIVFAQGASVGAIVAALDGAVLCQSTGYGDARKYTPSGERQIEVKLVKDGDLMLPDVEQPEFLTALQTALTKNNELYGTIQKLRTDLKAATDRVAKFETAAGVVPPAPTPTGDDVAL